MKKSLKYPNFKLYRGIFGIYQITIGNKKYIGSSVNLYKRIRTHLTTLSKNKHENVYLQRCYNKYGKNSLEIIILRTYDNISEKELLVKEKEFIDIIKPTINHKIDPVTQYNSRNTSKKVWQFSQKGEFIKTWESVSEACRFLKIHESNIVVSIKNPKRQRLAAGYLWSYTEICPPLELLYGYDYFGNYINSFINTVDIYEKMFSTENRKSSLSSLKLNINKQIPYKGYRFIKEYKEKLEPIEKLIYRFDLSGKMLNCFLTKNEALKYDKWKNIYLCLNNKTKSSKNYMWSYNDTMNIYDSNRNNKTKVIDKNNNTIGIFLSLNEASYTIFKTKEKSIVGRIRKTLNKNIFYKEYKFITIK
jgi:hypothetical protein